MKNLPGFLIISTAVSQIGSDPKMHFPIVPPCSSVEKDHLNFAIPVCSHRLVGSRLIKNAHSMPYMINWGCRFDETKARIRGMTLLKLIKEEKASARFTMYIDVLTIGESKAKSRRKR
jgi:hypothetical protein